MQVCTAAASAGWVSLSGDNSGVRKRVIVEGIGDVAPKGSEVEIDYVGTLAEQNWSAQDVVDCWLREQQGVESLAAAFLLKGVDGEKLLDDMLFTPEFVGEELGVGNKIQCKKLVMAARRLSKEKAEHPPGTEFDSSAGRGPYKFKLGEGKAIKAMELAALSMKAGEKAEIIARADYAYGKDGLRKSAGEVVVPPFATLSFVVTMLSC